MKGAVAAVSKGAAALFWLGAGPLLYFLKPVGFKVFLRLDR